MSYAECKHFLWWGNICNMEAGFLVGAVSIINWPRAMPTGMMGVVPVLGIGSILHIVYLLCDFLLLHLRRGAQEGPIVPPQAKSPVRPNKKPHSSSFSCLLHCAFPARGVVLAFLKVKSLHVSDSLISLSGVSVGPSLMDMLSSSCCW